MDEFLYELRDHTAVRPSPPHARARAGAVISRCALLPLARAPSQGLNCGRWDYIFSTIKRLRNHPQFVLPDRADVTMTVPFMANYVQLLIKTCHRRGVHAMGGACHDQGREQGGGKGEGL